MIDGAEEREFALTCVHCRGERDSSCVVVWERYEINVVEGVEDGRGEMDHWLVGVGEETVGEGLVDEPELGAGEVKTLGALKEVVRGPYSGEVGEEEVVEYSEETGIERLVIM